MADGLKTFQVVAQVEYDTPPLLKVFQVIAQVEYAVTPAGTFIYFGTIPVTVAPSCVHNIEFIKTGIVPVTVTPISEYYIQVPGERVYIGNIGVTVTPQSGVTREWTYAGSIPVAVTPSCIVEIPVHIYEGLIGIEVLPASSYRLPIVGWDKYTGYGMIDISFLTEDPPFWGVEGNIVLTINPAAANIGGASVTVFIGSGGIEFGGEGVITFTVPPVLEVVGEGGIEFGGHGIISIVLPKVSLHVGSGGIQFGGHGVIEVTYPVVPPVLSIVGSGGIVFGGAGVITWSLPPVLTIIGSGGMVFGEFRVPELTVVRFVYPADMILATIIGSGGMVFGGAGVIAWDKPSVYVVPTPQAAADANIFFGGAGVIAFIYPTQKILQIVGEGGVIFGGESAGDEVFGTYTICGSRGEPSIYSGFNFNSYATYKGQVFGAGPDGIYLLEGADDDGETIHSGVRIGPNNYGTDREKRLRLLRCGGKTVGAKARVSNGNGSSGYYDVESGRAAVSRDVQGREITIDITDFEELTHLEIVPLILAKR